MHDNLKDKKYIQRLRMLSHNAKLYLMLMTLQGLSFGIWGVIFNLYLNLREVGFQPDFIGNMFTMNALATGIVALPAGLLCERFGPKKSLLISLTSNFFSLIQIMSLEPSILLFASLTSGLIGTLGWVASAPFMMENSTPEERTYLFSVDGTIMVLTGVVGSYVGGFMPDMFNSFLGLPSGAENGSPVGYRITLFISIVLALIGVIPLLFIKENKTVKRQRIRSLISLQNIKSSKVIVKFMIPAALIGFGAGFVIPLFNIFFKLKFAATTEQIGIISALSSITLSVGLLVAPVLANKMGKVKSVVACQLLSTPFIMLITLSPNLPLATSAYIIRGALMNMAGPISATFQMEMVTETERATTSGFMIMADNIPRAVTASISGQMMTKNDFYTPFLITTITYIVASMLYFTFFRKAEDRQN